jgi:hypothetical protein
MKITVDNFLFDVTVKSGINNKLIIELSKI